MAILVYTTILSNVVTTNAIKLVPTAAKAAGLPASSAIALLEALPLGTAASEKVPGVRLEIVEAAGAAYQQAYVVGLRTTALSSLSFGICVESLMSLLTAPLFCELFNPVILTLL